MRINWSAPEGPTRTHSDLAIWGNIMVAGNYDGFRLFDLSQPIENRLIVNFLCRGPQNDVSIWEHNGRRLLFQSVDTPQRDGLTVCSQVRTSDTPVSDPLGFEGIRVFDITNPAAPVYVKGVRTNCGSHTHTVIPDLGNNRVLIYATAASTSGGPYCQIPHNRIPIVAVPFDTPETASVISEPRLISSLRGCHDITVFLALDLAAAACESEGQFWDISNPAAPDTANPIARIDTPSVNYWHSAEFTWDGQYVVFDDETFVSQGCSPTQTTGKVWIYRVSDRALMSSFMTPRNLGSGIYCGSHNGNVIPVAGRYLLVMSWYAGGTSVVDFTNPAAPQEIAFYKAIVGRGAADTWSSYWYNGSIYANDIVRGVDVFNILTPSNPYGGLWNHLNPQTQEALYPSPFASRTPLARLVLGATARPDGPAARQGQLTRSTARGLGWPWRSRARAGTPR